MLEMEKGIPVPDRLKEDFKDELLKNIDDISSLNSLILNEDKESALHVIRASGRSLVKRYDIICYYATSGFLDDISGYPLNVAALFGDVELFEAMVGVGFDPRVDNEDVLTMGCRGDAPLIIAVKYGSYEIVRLLIEKYGVSPNIRTISEKETPLHLAAFGHLDIVTYLVEKGADVNALSNSGFMPINNAIKCEDICRYLLDNGTNMKLLNETSAIVSFACVVRPCYNVIKMLLEHGASVNKRHLHSTALIYATKKKDLELMKLLHVHGADPDLNGRNGERPLHIAAKQRYTICARYLIVHMNAQLDNTFCGKSAFALAVEWCEEMRFKDTLTKDYGSAKFLNLLLDAGYNPKHESCLQHSFEEPLVEVMKRAQYIASNPFSLQDMCCSLIRKIVIRKYLDKLYLPSIIRDKISLRNLAIDE